MCRKSRKSPQAKRVVVGEAGPSGTRDAVALGEPPDRASGGAVPSRWTCSSAFGRLRRRRSSQAPPATTGGARRRGSPDARSPRAPPRPPRRRSASSRAWTTASGAPGPDRGARRGDLGQPDGGVDHVVLARAAAAEADDDEPERARVDARSRRRPLGRDRADDRRAGRCARVLEQVGRAAERGDHAREALGGGAARRSAASGSASRSPPSASSGARSASVTSCSRGSAPRRSGSARCDSRTSSALPAVRAEHAGPCR